MNTRHFYLFALLLLTLPTTTRADSRLKPDAAQISDLDLRKLEAIEPLVKQAIDDKKLPGAVVLIGRGNDVVYQKAFGNRAMEPAVEPMTLDTVFDLASLTKVVATTTSVMLLVEEGRIRLERPGRRRYIPGFERYGKGEITIRHLMTHVSGLRPDLDLATTAGPGPIRRSSWRSRKCRPIRRARASSTPTSTSSCSATSSAA